MTSNDCRAFALALVAAASRRSPDSAQAEQAEPRCAVPPPEADPCEVPGYILFGDSKLDHVKKAVEERKRLNILVIGSGSSVMPGPDGGRKGLSRPAGAGPAKALSGRRNQALLHSRNRARPQPTWRRASKRSCSTASRIWWYGRLEPWTRCGGSIRRASVTSLDEGIDQIVEAGADLILMNMQYSPRTETMIPLVELCRHHAGGGARSRSAAVRSPRDHAALERNGNFDLNLATKDSATAYKVHDCLGQALASLVIEAAQSRRHKAETDAVTVFPRPFPHSDTLLLDRGLARPRTGLAHAQRSRNGGGIARPLRRRFLRAPDDMTRLMNPLARTAKAAGRRAGEDRRHRLVFDRRRRRSCARQIISKRGLRSS